MTRAVWLKADDETGDWDARRKRITTGLEAGVDWVLVDQEDVERVRELGQVNVAAFGTENRRSSRSESESESASASESESDSGSKSESESASASESKVESDAAIPEALVVGKGSEGDGTLDLPGDHSGSADISRLQRANGHTNGAFVRIRGKAYESLAEAAASHAEYTLIVGEDWKIIPLENLIARIGGETTLVAGVQTADEARTAFETLERGADAVLLDTDDPDEIRKTVETRDAVERETLDLTWATVTAVEQTGSADRVCVDTGNLFEHDEGMLVGSMSRGLFFVHAETAESPYVASRPFRVNAGAVHAYARGPDGSTKYLSELKSGDEVQIVDTDGDTRETVVGRVKIERRPMFRVQAEVNGDTIETLLQNAETIKIATRDGRKAITDLEAEDEVLVYYEDTARHFGETVEESIIEK